jgi:hypothetical protein
MYIDRLVLISRGPHSATAAAAPQTTIRTNTVMSETFVILPVALCAATAALQSVNFMLLRRSP